MSQNISSDEIVKLEQSLNQKHSLGRSHRFFKIKATIDQTKKTVFVQVLLKSEDETFYYPVQAQMYYENEDQSPREACLFLLDYIDLYYEDFFDDDEQLYLPIDWTEYQYEACAFEIRGQIYNRHLEEIANKLLGETRI